MNKPMVTAINKIPLRVILSYFWTKNSLFRFYQNEFLQLVGQSCRGNIVELGGERMYGHSRFFPFAESYVCTNVARDYDKYADILSLPFEDNSQDVYICVSVLEHVFNWQQALSEIKRTLKPGGVLILVIPFAYPFHDEVDYWRFAKSTYSEILADYHYDIVHLGGAFSATAGVLQRPRGKQSIRCFLRRIVGFFALLMGRFLKTADGFPMGYGVYATKK